MCEGNGMRERTAVCEGAAECKEDSVCEVAVCTGDNGGHVRTCSRVSRGECECNGVVYERRDMQVCGG